MRKGPLDDGRAAVQIQPKFFRFSKHLRPPSQRDVCSQRDTERNRKKLWRGREWEERRCTLCAYLITTNEQTPWFTFYSLLPSSLHYLMKWFHSAGREQREIERKGTTGSLLCNKSVYALQICAEQQRYFGRATCVCIVWRVRVSEKNHLSSFEWCAQYNGSGARW